ncbi:cold shock domain-containing protein [Catenuloplanes atrovinosus]|uniref:CspA family cold shock protein n=1 Tax=Catenuloplanes atrovinosus TaxID=137266 RepID=A0AAE4CAQ1_9ACTN|nr:cold shock domain-containing protein [Catenuloplanes atrovinosus]MDR7277811.1 CspA family cold shock protein [Catenuloplanes atrovinosus]
MTVDATVREWHADQGWGVLDSAETPGGCWAHFSAAATPGAARLAPGTPVRLDWESPGQDGYPFRAVRFWPAGSDPRDDPAAGPGAAYSSTLSLSFDDD